MQSDGTQANQANVEYFFRLLYDCFHGGCGTINFSFGGLLALLAHLWVWIVIVGYILAVCGLFVIIYSTIRLLELRKREEEFYHTLILAPDEISGGHPRWAHVQSLMAGNSASEWRDAIIEADIMLDEALTKQGYVGEGVGEKLQVAKFATIQDAWEAHKVRNQIAHQGSSFDLTESLARRTLAHYEAVFREFKMI